jgi:hypothetical protein
MTDQDPMRADLEALEKAAPRGLPPRPALVPRRGWLRLAGPAVVMVLAGVLIGIGLPSWLRGIRPPGSIEPSASELSVQPSPTQSPAALDIDCAAVDAELCAQVVESALSNVPPGSQAMSIAIAAKDYWCEDCSPPIWREPFAVVVRFSDAQRPVDLDCAVEANRVVCSSAVAATAHDAQIGMAYPIRIYTHCGLPPIEFDGNRWVIEAAPTDDGRNTPAGFEQSDGGTLTLISENEGIYRSQNGIERRVTRGGGVPIRGCL